MAKRRLTQIAKEFDIPFELILAFIECESDGDRYAVRSELKRYVRNPKTNARN